MVDLRGVEAFNPNKIPELEEYLARQVGGGEGWVGGGGGARAAACI